MAKRKTNKKKLKITSQQEWLEARQLGVGSSDSPVLALEPEEVFGNTALDIYISKKSPPRDEPDNVNFRRGHAYEPLAIVLAEQKMGMKIHAPKTDMERWNDFRVEDPNNPWLYGDFDGLREDGWVIEVKSPRQMIADKIKATGLKRYYLVQGQHLCHIASVGTLPVLGKLPAKCPGVCFVIYEPENVDVQIYEIPRDDTAIAAIIQNADRFWNNHVIPNEPPTNMLKAQVPFVPQKTSYMSVGGDAWEEALRQYLLTKEQLLSVEQRFDIAKNRIREAMDKANLDKIILNGKHKFSNAEQRGRRSFDKKAFQAAHPNIDLTQFEAEGKPFKAFRYYGPKDEMNWGDETLDGQLLSLKDELDILGKRAGSMEMDDVIERFDELRSRTDMYTRMLALELETIQKQMGETENSVLASMKRTDQEADDE